MAKQRCHRETGEKPDDRLRPESLRSVPALLPDYHDTVEALVHKDIRSSFDGNRYCQVRELFALIREFGPEAVAAAKAHAARAFGADYVANIRQQQQRREIQPTTPTPRSRPQRARH